ncbi:putative ABC transporter ATP-binding protein YheS [Bhargavaea cecembensis DSE10]|uniref:Putative ABC transporter ATP-binding protein YheS n=1 Tax=Bhargavaea cecembensis DSE10 TaxID=1235279 RepID=M7NGS4_9BACL|nr:ABC-F family ATP-binding cassette domain-containing protein [Bhargavaea cecembensis]EMR06386.1 putative ABC transporter ATP-binding protein YheS [Bhargavaea cecembensis DSE10]
MLLGRLEELTVVYGDVTIFEKVSADIPEGAVIALVGPNGAGKSTLMERIAGRREPSSGRVRWHGKRPSVTYFRQEEVAPDLPAETGEVLAERKKWRLSDEVAYNTASGGERMKLRLSAALVEPSRLVLLDEPTNHLDREALERLIGQISESRSTFIVVSHDRHFIDRVADSIWELDHGTLTEYEGNYTNYRNKKEAARAAQQRHYEQQQKKVARVEEQLSQLSDWSDRAHRESTKKGGMKEYYRVKAKKKDIQIRSKRKRLEAELEKDGVEKPEEEASVTFDVKGGRRKGMRVFELRDVSKSFGKRTLFRDVRFTVLSGERLALLGPNGSGKTTLFRMLLGEEPHEGEIWRTEGMTVGVLSQSVLDLPLGKTMEAYFSAATFEQQGKLRTDLANLGFTAQHWTLPLSRLSMGERLKVKLMRFILEGTDVLLLDEPTNHLDLPSREELERTLGTFPGTLLFASHDRYFTGKLADGILVFAEGTVRKLPMTPAEWEEKRSGEGKDRDGKVMEEERLRLETERQAVLGKLSLLSPGDPDYAGLDTRFLELTREIRQLEEHRKGN